MPAKDIMMLELARNCLRFVAQPQLFGDALELIYLVVF
jgi:hypothetical protein